MSAADDIRKSLNIIETKPKSERLDEAMPMGFIKRFATAAGALFSDIQAGKLETGNAANAWYKYYLNYLGKIGKKAETGTVSDLFDFFANSGFNQDAVLKGMAIGFGLPIKTLKDVAHYGSTAHKTKDKLTKTFLNIVQQQSRKPAAQLDSDDFEKRSKENAPTVAKIDAAVAKKEEPAKAAPTPTKPSPAETKPTAPTDDVKTELTGVIGSKDRDSILANIDRALKALGA